MDDGALFPGNGRGEPRVEAAATATASHARNTLHEGNRTSVGPARGQNVGQFGIGDRPGAGNANAFRPSCRDGRRFRSAVKCRRRVVMRANRKGQIRGRGVVATKFRGRKP